MYVNCTTEYTDGPGIDGIEELGETRGVAYEANRVCRTPQSYRQRSSAAILSVRHKLEGTSPLRPPAPTPGRIPSDALDLDSSFGDASEADSRLLCPLLCL